MASTPISRSKTSALARVLDSLPKGYTRYTSGVVSVDKAARLIKKLHDRHGVGCTPGQRTTRKQRGRANALLVMFWPTEGQHAYWLMLFTPGELDSPEQLQDVALRPRLQWLGYELIRHTDRGKEAWTWRRPKQAMAEHHAVIAELSNKRQTEQLASFLQILANQPGFHGVRAQTWSLFGEALKRGFPKERLPHIFFVSKVSHGDKLPII